MGSAKEFYKAKILFIILSPCQKRVVIWCNWHYIRSHLFWCPVSLVAKLFIIMKHEHQHESSDRHSHQPSSTHPRRHITSHNRLSCLPFCAGRCSNAVLLEICLFQGRQRLSCKSLAIRLKNVKKKQFPASRAAASLGRSFRLCSKILKAHLLWGGCAWSCCKSPCRMAWLNTGQRLDAPTTSTTVFCVHLFSYRALRGISRNLSLDVDTRDAWYRFIKVT